MGVVAEPVEQLGPVGLSIDGLKLVPLDEAVPFNAPFRRFGRMRVGPFPALPHPGEGPEGPEVGEGVGITLGLRIEVVTVVAQAAGTHGGPSPVAPCQSKARPRFIADSSFPVSEM